MSGHQLLSLFEEMNLIADALPMGMAFEDDCKLEFRALQKRRFADLSREEWTDLFYLWRDCYRARLRAKDAEKKNRFAELVEERRSLMLQRAFTPPLMAAVANDRLLAIGHELAGICTPGRPLPSLGTWGAE
jgi:hypothetical protein